MDQCKNLPQRLIRFLSKHIKGPQDIEGVHPFFSTLYDEIYHEIMFKHIAIQKNILRIFERLALPLETSTPQQRREIYQRILMIKDETFKKKYHLGKSKLR
jgi:hypothetical protein